DLTAIGDTYIVAMNIYSHKVDNIEDALNSSEKIKVAVPNDATNEGRALKLLEQAGFFTIDPNAGASPEISDITEYKTEIEFVEVDANLVFSVLDDVTIAVINGNYALDSGLTADDAIFKESKYDDNSYYCLIAVRSEDADNEVYKRIVEEYQTQSTIDIFNTTFAGFFVPAWTLE
ncbi:MAG: MetQ/NlpA family ABC transporter substrate-binding protein, partial [Oscillospiraceae bacterium]